MATITKLTPISKRKQRTMVYLDGVPALELADSVVASLGLRVGAEITETDIEAAAGAERGFKALQTALTYLEPRMRSRAEIVTRLRQKQFDDDAIDHALRRLDAMGLIDDAEFAGRWVAARAKPEAGRPIGRRRLKSELIVKGIPAEEIQQALDAVTDEDEHTLALAAARKKLRVIPTDPETLVAERRRLAAFLQRRGFGWEVVKKVMDEVLRTSDEDE